MKLIIYILLFAFSSCITVQPCQCDKDNKIQLYQPSSELPYYPSLRYPTWTPYNEMDATFGKPKYGLLKFDSTYFGTGDTLNLRTIKTDTSIMIKKIL